VPWCSIETCRGKIWAERKWRRGRGTFFSSKDSGPPEVLISW
jgi:hypothetical protein